MDYWGHLKIVCLKARKILPSLTLRIFSIVFFFMYGKHCTFYSFCIPQLCSTVGMYSILPWENTPLFSGLQLLKQFSNFTLSCFYWRLATYYYYFKDISGKDITTNSESKLMSSIYWFPGFVSFVIAVFLTRWVSLY